MTQFEPYPCTLQYPVEEYFVPIRRSNGQTTKVEPFFLDTETTGLNHQTCDVVELALVSLEDTVLHAYLPIRNGAEVSETAMKINGHNEAFARSTAAWRENYAAVLQECQRLWSGKMVVGSNPTFDMAFLERDLWQILRQTPTWFYKPFDITVACFLLLDNVQSLQGIGKAFQTPTVAEHSALADAHCAREAYISFMNAAIATRHAISEIDEGGTDEDVTTHGATVDGGETTE